MMYVDGILCIECLKDVLFQWFIVGFAGFFFPDFLRWCEILNSMFCYMHPTVLFSDSDKLVILISWKDGENIWNYNNALCLFFFSSQSYKLKEMLHSIELSLQCVSIYPRTKGPIYPYTPTRSWENKVHLLNICCCHLQLDFIYVW